MEVVVSGIHFHDMSREVLASTLSISERTVPRRRKTAELAACYADGRLIFKVGDYVIFFEDGHYHSNIGAAPIVLAGEPLPGVHLPTTGRPARFEPCSGSDWEAIYYIRKSGKEYPVTGPELSGQVTVRRSRLEIYE